MQYRLNERLLAILYSERPVAFTDMGGLTGPGNTVAVTDASGQVRAPPCMEWPGAVVLRCSGEACLAHLCIMVTWPRGAVLNLRNLYGHVPANVWHEQRFAGAFGLTPLA